MASQISDQLPISTGVSFASAMRSCLPTGFVVVDGARRIATINETAATWLNLDSAAVLRSEFDALPGPQREIFDRAWAASGGVADFSFELSNPAGAPVSLHARALRQHGTSASVVLLLSEAAPAQKLDCHLARLDRLVTLGTLSAGLAHELRNALVSTKTFVELLLERDPGNEFSEIVPREILHIETLLGQMLRQAVPEDPQFRVLNIHETLDHSLRLLRHQLSARQISLHKHYASQPALVKGDPDQLQQVFVNLVLNATEASEAGGEVILRTAVVPGGVAILVEDTGCGIDPANLERVFEPFFTTKSDGSGLGLPMSRRILRAHGGEIRAANRHGRGAVFTIELPIARIEG